MQKLKHVYCKMNFHDVKSHFEVNERKDEVKSSVLNPNAQVWSEPKRNCTMTTNPVECNCTMTTNPVEHSEVHMPSYFISFHFIYFCNF